MTGLWSQACSVAPFEPSTARDPESPYTQELVLFGAQLDPKPLQVALAACLMAPGEPFPAWNTYGIDDTCEHEPEFSVSTPAGR